MIQTTADCEGKPKNQPHAGSEAAGLRALDRTHERAADHASGRSADSTPLSYRGPERRMPARDCTRDATRDSKRELASCLSLMIDEIDYGMVLADDNGKVGFVNHAARLELDGEHPLIIRGDSLATRQHEDLVPLYETLGLAQRGLRRLLTLGQGSQRVSISVVPLPDASSTLRGGSGYQTLLMLGKRQVCAPLSVHGYARSHELTPAETRVLEALCQGIKPSEIARLSGVAVSTVRTQIGSLRVKTGTSSIRDLVHQVAVLPPLIGALRGSGPRE